MGYERQLGARAQGGRIARRRHVLDILRTALIGGVLCSGSWAIGCKCRTPPPPVRRDAAVADAAQGTPPGPLAQAEARHRWVRLVGADETRFRTLLGLERDLRKRCTDPAHPLAADDVAPLGRFMTDVASAVRTPRDREVVAALAAVVERFAGRRCDEALGQVRSLFGGAR
jgi:hypothetical protein